jgi:hypothetical protein
VPTPGFFDSLDTIAIIDALEQMIAKRGRIRRGRPPAINKTLTTQAPIPL